MFQNNNTTYDGLYSFYRESKIDFEPFQKKKKGFERENGLNCD